MSVLLKTALCSLFSVLSIFIVVPFLCLVFPGFMQHLFFLSFVKVPWQEYNNLSDHGVKFFGRNFYLSSSKDVLLGCWHIAPASLSAMFSAEPLMNTQMEQSLSSPSHPIIIYLHGNAFDRTGEHRCGLYNVLASMDFHVLAIDYRGYGDSSGSPSEAGVIEDAKAMYEYVRKHAGDNQVYLWGHSMGTGVATAAAMELSESGAPFAGLVLEAPFNNLRDAVINHPYSIPFRWMPWFDEIFVHPLLESGLNMSTDLRLLRVTRPVLILHAADDHIIPSKLGRLLYNSAKSAGRDVTYIEFDAARRFRHKYIYKAMELPTILRHFVQKCTA